MSTPVKSHVKNGHVYFKKTGRYNEVTTEAIHTTDNNASSAARQKRLAKKGKKSAAAMTLLNAGKELGWE